MKALPVVALLGACLLPAADSSAHAVFRQYCLQCHGKSALGGINLEKMSAEASIADSFQHWQKVARALEQKAMPPAKMPQPTDAQRVQAVAWIRTSLKDYATRNAGDPGRVTLRRLTSAEYGYTIHDLTGLTLNFDRDFASDAVGGEGFTNFGDVQFMADANLERYLEAAKHVADHAVIGAGPLQFYGDPGKSGFELSAIHRIREIYEKHGFRATAAEGAKPYGLDRYGKAFYAAWRYQYRKALGEPNATLATLAKQEGVSARFAEHIWNVLHEPAAAFPSSEVIARWRKLPPPPADATTVRAATAEVQKFVVNWPRWLFAAGELAEGGRGDERALILTEAALKPALKHKFTFNLRRRRGQNSGRIHMSAAAANPNAKEQPVVVWRNAKVRIRRADRSSAAPQSLREVLPPEMAAKLGFGADGLGPDDFRTAGGFSFHFEVATPGAAGGLQLQVEAEMDPATAGGAVLRCTFSDSDQESEGTPVSVLMANAAHPGFQKWMMDVLHFAANLPQNSQGEATPADRDEIPAPFDNTYNQPERDHFHQKLKYYRQDRFLAEKMLDDATRRRLEDAWSDLLASFEYHDLFLQFVAGKYKLDIKDTGIAQLTAGQIAAMPAEPRRYVQALRAEFDAVQNQQREARPRHLEDCLRFAAMAWRRPLSEDEKQQLRAFYDKARRQFELDHAKAIRSLLVRILVAPPFLYRLEQPKGTQAAPLSGVELASRLSYFLWSSIPDEELLRAATAGELNAAPGLQRQVKRMLADPKARRMAAEFFGQWLGFYRFDQHRGVDAKRFPEFTDEVKNSMYGEAVSFFEHILRGNRPVREILFADYTFLNTPLARHYGIEREIKSTEFTKVEGLSDQHRGGLLRLGAVLTATSAPLRTSPVKRGDWLLRRIVGTPVPPPPADAGSIPADDKLFGGMTVRQRLDAHRRNATCAGCHTRIDPLGFALEHYDSVGRWREQYPDGKPIDDSGTLADNTEIAGVSGLMDYLKANQEQVYRTLSSRLMGYALGRTILASDQPLLDEMAAAGSRATFAELVSKVVTSPQFRRIGGQSQPPPQVAQRTSGGKRQ
jgi:hypothetical protein